jgi:hypothetical protein
MITNHIGMVYSGEYATKMVCIYRELGSGN